MSNNKGMRRDLIETEARINELERARPYLHRDFYEDRTQSLMEKKDEIEKKVENGRLAPDIQYIIKEVEG
jgi:hypothetical protein